jgi:error-prone DNA polymerase
MDTESDLHLFNQQTLLPITNIPSPNASETLLEDYASTSLSLFTHPIDFLQKANLLPKHTQANKLHIKQHQTHVSVIGLVIGRQRLGTSKGVTFITLEDNTGNINVVVWLATSRAQKPDYTNTSKYVI